MVGVLTTLVYWFIGVVATLLGSMSGLGGGFLSVPLLYYIGVSMPIAVATSKFMVFINSIISTYRYIEKIKLPLNLYIAVVVPMIITAYLGAFLVAILPVNILSTIIGLILFVSALRMLLQRNNTGRSTSQKQGLSMYIQGAFSGALAGFVAGISGLGGGVVNVPVFIYILGLDPHLAVSLSMACIIPSSISSVIRHIIDGLIDWSIGIPLSIGALIGGWIGPRIALRMKKEKLVKIIGGVMIIATLRIIIESIIKLL